MLLDAIAKKNCFFFLAHLMRLIDGTIYYEPCQYLVLILDHLLYDLLSL